MSATHDLPKPRPLPRLLVVGLVSAALLWGAFSLYSMGQPLFGAILLGLATCFAVVFGSERFYGSRFIFPGIAAVLIFIASSTTTVSPLTTR